MPRGSSNPASTASGINFDSLRQLADTGNAQAQHEYSLCLFTGQGIPTDIGRAAHDMKLAADSGIAEA
jgi:TPR repeat protein